MNVTLHHGLGWPDASPASADHLGWPSDVSRETRGDDHLPTQSGGTADTAGAAHPGDVSRETKGGASDRPETTDALDAAHPDEVSRETRDEDATHGQAGDVADPADVADAVHPDDVSRETSKSAALACAFFHSCWFHVKHSHHKTTPAPHCFT